MRTTVRHTQRAQQNPRPTKLHFLIPLLLLECLDGENALSDMNIERQLLFLQPSALASAEIWVTSKRECSKQLPMHNQPRTATARHNPQQAVAVVPGLSLRAEVFGQERERAQ